MEKKNILLMEDDEPTAEVISMMLKKAGYDTKIVTTGEEAITFSLEHKTDLILADISLKGRIDGIEAVIEIKGMMEMPVIYTTAHADTFTLERARKTNPSGILIKPIVYKELISSIEVALQRNSLENKLKESEEKYKLIIEMINEGIWAADENHITTFVNKYTAGLLGYEIYEMIGKKMNWFILKEDMNDYNIQMTLLSHGKSFKYERGFKHKNGNRIWLFVSSRALLDDKNNFKGSFTLLTDITERKRAEEALLDNSIKLAESQRIGKLGYWDWDIAENSLSWSDEIYRIWGVGKDLPLTLDNIVGMIHPDDKELNSKKVQEFLTTHDKGEFEFRIICPDGTVKYIYQSIEVIRAPSGEPIKMFGIMQDITERKHSEDTFLLNEKRLHALSHRLLEIQETERKHIASELHDEIGQVLTAVQLNLHGIKQFGELKDIPRQLDDSISLIERSLQQVRNLAIDLRPWMLDQIGLIPSLRWFIDNQSQRTKIKTQFNADKIKERLSSDIEITCFRVVQEAFTNIHRHSQATKVNVTLKKIDNAIVVEISDNGIGFDVKKVRSRKISKHGLGLIDMEERVTLFNGTFNIVSAPGKGTTIQIRLPMDLSLFEQSSDQIYSI